MKYSRIFCLVYYLITPKFLETGEKENEERSGYV